MTWIQFLLAIAGLYSIYYLANIGIDVIKSRGPEKDIGLINELTFSEDIKPKKAEAPAPAIFPGTAAPVIASGGVSLKEIFSLARKDAIQLTRKVSF
jgi:hypothetical protein